MIRRSNTKLITPEHVAIIMDGNNRWTKKHKLKQFGRVLFCALKDTFQDDKLGSQNLH